MIRLFKKGLLVFQCLILGIGCTAQEGEKTSEEIYSEFTALEAPSEVYIHFRTLWSDSLRMELRNTSSTNRYFKVLIQLKDSVITEAYVQSRNKEISNQLSQKLQRNLIGARPDYEFIEKFKYGSYSFVMDKEKM